MPSYRFHKVDIRCNLLCLSYANAYDGRELAFFLHRFFKAVFEHPRLEFEDKAITEV